MRTPETPERAELDRVANLLMAEWERVEGAPVGASYVATFVDMARVVIRDQGGQCNAEHPQFGKRCTEEGDHDFHRIVHDGDIRRWRNG